MDDDKRDAFIAALIIVPGMVLIGHYLGSISAILFVAAAVYIFQKKVS